MVQGGLTCSLVHLLQPHWVHTVIYSVATKKRWFPVVLWEKNSCSVTAVQWWFCCTILQDCPSSPTDTLHQVVWLHNPKEFWRGLFVRRLMR